MEIEKGIPLDRPSSANARYSVLDLLQVGDSVLFPLEGLNISSLGACIGYRHGRYHKQFTRRKTADGIRVWRVQ